MRDAIICSPITHVTITGWFIDLIYSIKRIYLPSGKQNLRLSFWPHCTVFVFLFFFTLNTQKLLQTETKWLKLRERVTLKKQTKKNRRSSWDALKKERSEQPFIKIQTKHDTEKNRMHFIHKQDCYCDNNVISRVKLTCLTTVKKKIFVNALGLL